jgi:hypothetical protein
MSTTPILDSGTLLPPRPKKRILGAIIGLCIGLLFAAVIHHVSRTRGQNNLALFFYFANLVLVVTVHELAHLLAGWVVGFHFDRISIGPLSLRIEYGRLKIQFSPALPGALGYAGMNIQTVRKICRRLLVYIAAGPVMNLVSGILAAFFVRYPPLSLRTSWVVPFAAGFSLFSLLLGLVSLVPYGSTLRSDGARIWMLLTSAAKARRWIAAAALANQQKEGVRVKHWKQTWVKAVCALQDSSTDEVVGNMLAYVAASAKQDTKSSAAYLERCLELAPVAPPSSRDFVAREAAYFSAWFRNDLKLAERWSSQIKGPKLIAPLIEIRLAIALDCARCKFDAAITGWQKGFDFIERMPDIPMKAPLRESWQEWGEEIREKQTRQSEVTTADSPVLLG